MYLSRSEAAETFEVLLSGPTGGAVLGAHSVARVTIAKSDSLSGFVRFLNESRITLVNPNVTLSLTLVLERAGGFVGNATVRRVTVSVVTRCERSRLTDGIVLHTPDN